MGSKTRLSSYCTKRANNGVNLVTSRKINTRLARPIEKGIVMIFMSNMEYWAILILKLLHVNVKHMHTNDSHTLSSVNHCTSKG